MHKFRVHQNIFYQAVFRDPTLNPKKDSSLKSIKYAFKQLTIFYDVNNKISTRSNGSRFILGVSFINGIPKDVIQKAAAIAAYHSKQRNGGVVAVTGTRAANVTKPRGAKPGSVAIKKEVVFKVRPGIPGEA